jgi:hypothetical protein
MKSVFYSLSGLGLVSILMMGALVSRAQAGSHGGGQCLPKSPLRGTYVFSQVAYVVPGVTGPVTEAGTITVDDCGNLSGHGVFDASVTSGVEFDFAGTCVLRESGAEADCTLTGNIGRYCVLTGRSLGGCFGKWHCISSNPAGEPGVVLLADLERQQGGTCR